MFLQGQHVGGQRGVDLGTGLADVDGAALVADTHADVGEAGAQVDAALAAHVIATQGGAR